MPSDISVLITNIYNEEYLLPFWLNHHKKIFDHGIIIDYGSTDKSLEICKEICPNWEIRKTKNADFAAANADQELMNVENQLNGIKMILTITEFLFCERPLKEIFINNKTTNVSFAVKQYAAYTETLGMYPKDLKDLYKDVMKKSVLFYFQENIGPRQIHNFSNGNYNIGRHATYNPSVETTDMHILWLGSFPLNEHTMNRKVNVKTFIPESDVNQGYSLHHFYDESTMLDKISLHYNMSNTLESVNKRLLDLIVKEINA